MPNKNITINWIFRQYSFKEEIYFLPSFTARKIMLIFHLTQMPFHNYAISLYCKMGYNV